MPLVTVAICTYRRPLLLAKCLAGLSRQTAAREEFTVLVVDNYGDEATRTVAAEYGAAYVHEATAGLSHARNRAAAETATEWIFYLDDDGIPHRDMIENFITALNRQEDQPPVIGGRYEHYFAATPPPWITRYYAQDVRPTARTGRGKLLPDEHLNGGIMAARTSLVRQYPFRTDLGMTANTVGYGEETEWQDRLWALGYARMYDESIAMRHLVGKHKLTVWARLAAARAHGRYQARTRRDDSRPGWLTETLRVIFVTLPYDLARVLFRPGFSWQNGVVSTLGKLAFIRGKYGR